MSATKKADNLSEAVRRKPYSVVLFDEIEKAHHDVFNVLLQVLDDGRITDGQGRTVDFKNTVIIMTSNIGSQFITEEASSEGRSRLVWMRCAQHFRPEFLNRVDEIIIFDRLNEEDLKKIVEIQLRRLTKRLENQKITLELTDAAKARIAREGYDPVYGARPLKRAIQKEILDPLSLQILEGKFHEGQTIRVDERTGETGLRSKVTHGVAGDRPRRRGHAVSAARVWHRFPPLRYSAAVGRWTRRHSFERAVYGGGCRGDSPLRGSVLAGRGDANARHIRTAGQRGFS